MAAQATGTFTVSSWDEDTYQELDGGGKLTRARVSFGLSGDLDQYVIAPGLGALAGPSGALALAADALTKLRHE